MADRNISIRVTANVGGYSKSVRAMATQTERFASALGKVNSSQRPVAQQARMTSEAYNSMTRGMGVARAETGRFSAAMNAGQKALQNSAEATGVLNKGLVSMRSFAASAAAAFGGFLAINAVIGGVRRVITEATSAFLDFERSMNETFSIAGELSDVMKNDMSNAARELAKNSTFSAAQVADGFFELTQSGLNAADAITALPLVTRFAQAGAFDLGTATDLLTDAVSALGWAVREDAVANLVNMTRVADVLTRSAQLTNSTVEQMSKAMTNRAATAARLLGKDVEELAAVLSVYADAGVKGQVAGTQLSIAWRDLQTRALSNAGMFKQMGIEVFDASGQMNHTADIIRDIEVALDGMSTAQQRAALRALEFQDRSVAALLTLVGTSDEIRRMDSAYRDAGGTVEEVAKKQLESFANQLTVVKNRLLDLAIGAGYSLTNFATTVSKEVGPTLAALSELFQKVWESTAPFRSAILTTAMVALGGAFKGALMVLEPFAKLLADHSRIVGALVATYVTYRGAMFAANAIQQIQIGTTLAHTAAVTANTAAVAANQVVVDQFGFAHVRAGAAAQGATGIFQRFGAALGNGMGAVRNMDFSLKGLAASGRGLLGSLGKIASSGAFKFGVAAGGLLMLKNYFDGVTESARKAADEITEQFNTDTAAGLRDAVNANRQAALDHADAAGISGNALSRFGNSVLGAAQVMTPFTENTIVNSRTALIAFAEETAEAREKLQLMENSFARVRVAAQGTDEQIEAAAKTLGIDLTNAAGLTVTETQAIQRELSRAKTGFEILGGSVDEFEDLSVEEMQSVAGEAESMASRMAEAFASFSDMGAAVEAATTESMNTAQIYQDMYDQRVEQAEKSAQEARDRRAQVLDDELADLRRARADAEAEDKAMWDTRIRNAEDAKKAFDRQEIAEVSVPAPSLHDWTAAIREQDAIRREFYEGQQALIRAGANMDFVSAIREMGPELGMQVINQTLEELYIAQMSTLDSFALVPHELHNQATVMEEAARAYFAPLEETFSNAEELIGLDEFQATLEEQRAEAEAFMENIQTLLSLEGVNTEMVIELASDPANARIMQELVGMGESAVDEINKMSDNLFFTDPAMQAEFAQQIASFWGNVEADGVDAAVQRMLSAPGGLDRDQIRKILEEASGTRSDVAEYLGTVDEGLNSLTYDADQYVASLERRVNQAHEMRLTVQVDVEGEGADLLDGIATNSNMSFNPLTNSWTVRVGSNSGGGSSPTIKSSSRGIQHRANGGYDPGIFGRSDGIRVFNEPETGGEAYIPLGRNKRVAALRVFDQVAQHFGVGISQFANGGIYRGGYASMTGSAPAASIPETRIRVIPVEVPVQKNNNTVFTGPINATDVADIKRQADRRKRLNNATGMGV